MLQGLNCQKNYLIFKKFMNNPDYTSLIAKSKDSFHNRRARVSFEEKLKVIIELQKLDIEMSRSNHSRKTRNKGMKAWEIIF